MYLKIIWHRRLLEFLFKTQVEDAIIFLEDLLSHFKKIENFFELPSDSILYLNEVIEKFKNRYYKILDSSPPPFSFLLISEIKDLPDFLLRAGKIYLTSDAKNEIDKILKKEKIYYKIEPWQDIFELILPSTADSKLLVFYKDIFWTGKEPLCFFCKSTLHPYNKCPGLLNPDPLESFKELFKCNFSEISKIMWENISKKGLNNQKLKYFHTRYFYLFPYFLKFIFFKYSEIEEWRNFKIDLTLPVMGGDLGVGLEFLIKNKLEEAEKRFIPLSEKDFRGSLGQAFVNILKKDLKRAIYYIEDALEKVKVPFVKSYLLFLKGYIYEHEREEFLARDFYKDALKVDSKCLPAIYHLNLLEYRRELEFNKIMPALDHSYFLYWGFLDPIFIKHQKQLEEFIFDKIAEKREIAIERLKEAEDKFFVIKEFIKEDIQKDYQEKLKKIQEDIYKGGLGTIENASDLALELALEFQGYLFKKIKELQAKINDLKILLQKIKSFWRRYPYKYEDIQFGNILKRTETLLNRAEKRIKGYNLSKILKIIISEIEKSEELIKELQIQEVELRKKWTFRKRLYVFLKNLIISEGILLGLYLFFYVFMSSKLTESFFGPGFFIIISFIVMIICLINAYLQSPE